MKQRFLIRDGNSYVWNRSSWVFPNSNDTTQTQMTQQERLELRQQNCGSFEYRLIEAWYAADNINKKALEEAFKNTQFDLT